MSTVWARLVLVDVNNGPSCPSTHTTAKRDAASIDVEVAPAQTEQLRATRPGDSRREQEHVQERIAVSNEVQQ